MWNYMFTEQLDRVHRPFMRDCPELHHRQELIQLGGFLQTFELLDRGVRASADAHSMFDQRIDRDLAWIQSLVLSGQVRHGSTRGILRINAGLPGLDNR